jgi:serine protease Do
MNKLWTRNIGLSVALTIMLGALTPIGAEAQSKSRKSSTPSSANTNPPPRLTIEKSELDKDVKASTSLAPIVKRIAPSVANIYSTIIIRDRSGSDPHSFFNHPALRGLFGDDIPLMKPRERKAQSLGSGVVVSSNGYLLTASHVVEGADSVKVALTLPGGEKEFDAKVIGSDPATDIAVLKIETSGSIPAIIIGDSDTLEVGDMVLALGNPFGVGQTVTTGIISGLNRGGFDIVGYEDYIQTDAAINQGNSGGALVDAQGRLVGINTAILSRSGGSQGVGFAVPVNMARYVLERITTEGKVRRGYLGINIQPLDPRLAKEFNLPEGTCGVLVGGVMPGGSADKAGLRGGDLILEVNGKRVPEPRNLQLLVAQNAPGSKVNLKVLRGDSNKKPVEKTITAVLGELPTELASRGLEDPEPGKGQDTLDGVEVADLDSRTRRQFEIPNSVRGALVNNVEDSSPAAEAGLLPGDVILQINRKPVASADEAVELSEKAKDGRVLLQIWRGGRGSQGGTRYVVIESPEAEAK